METQKILLEGVYTYQYLIVAKDSMKRYSKTKKEFYRNLTVEDITDTDFKHTKKV